MTDTPLPETVSRRQLLATAGGLAAGGLTWATVGTRGVRANVTPGDFGVSDGEYAATEGTIYSPVLSLDVGWAYEGVDAAAQVMVASLVDGGLLTSETLATSGPSDSGRVDLREAIVAARTVDSNDFDAPDGGESQTDVTVEVRLEVRDGSGETLAGDSVSDTATIVVSDAGPAMSASLGGSGSWSFEESTPTA